MNYDRLIWKILNDGSSTAEASLLLYLNELEPSTFLAYLHQHKIAGIVGYRLTQSGNLQLFPQQVQQALKQHKRTIALYNQLAKAELIQFVNSVNDPVCLVKGIAFECERLYPEGVRAVGDLDVVMKYPSCVRAWDKVIEAGLYSAEEDFPSAIHKRVLNQFPSYEHHHLPALTSMEIKMLSVEIHAQLFNPSMGANSDLEYLCYTFSTEAFDQRIAVPEIPGCYQFPDTYHFLFVCMHVMDNWHKGELTWRMLCDVYQFTCQHSEMDWTEIIKLARKLRLYSSLNQCLGIVSTYLPLQVPSVLPIQSEYFPKQMDALNRMGKEYAVRLPLKKRMSFYLRHMSASESLVYIFRTAFPKRAYLKVRYARMYQEKGYLRVLYFHLRNKSGLYFHKTVL